MLWMPLLQWQLKLSPVRQEHHGEMPQCSNLKKENIERQSTGGKKENSRFTTSVKRLRFNDLELLRVRQSFFSDIINKNNTKILHLTLLTKWHIVDKLMNLSASVPPELLSTKSCNDFASFFTDKITKIRKSVTPSQVKHLCHSCLHIRLL